jgi:hypothetical protein
MNKSLYYSIFEREIEAYALASFLFYGLGAISGFWLK